MTILCVDPDTEAGRETAEALSAAGFEVRYASDPGEAASAAEDPAVECIVTEHDLGNRTGLELIRAARERNPDVSGILFTEVPVEELTDVMGETIVEYLDKGVDGAREDLVDLVRTGAVLRGQTAYPLPDDEEARLAALDRYALDSAELAASLDRLTEIAAATFDVDAAVVGFVDAHHEEFTSCFGTDLEELDRDRTICTYAILDDDVTVVEDTTEDPRFENNEGLREANIRFYAGAPIDSREGHPIGTFCLHDGTPGTLDADERRILSLFAEEVADQLELRRRIAEGG